jgi:phosphatidylinositol-3-phosphatase
MRRIYEMSVPSVLTRCDCARPLGDASERCDSRAFVEQFRSAHTARFALAELSVRFHVVSVKGNRHVAMGCLALISAIGCSPNNSGTVLRSPRSLESMAAPVTPVAKGTVFTIVVENHSASQLLSPKSHAKFIRKMAAEYSTALGYHDSFVHPSEANYLWMTSGQNFEVLDDDDPRGNHLTSTAHIADQIEAAGLTWKSYQEAMGEPCGIKSHGRYAAKHNPFVFFDDVNGWDGTRFQPSQRCTDRVVDYSVLDKDIAAGTVPDYVFITPDLDHDMHDGTVREADEWLEREITKIMASDAYKKGGAIFLLGDEGGGFPARDDPPFIIISDMVKKGFVSRVNYDTSSYLKTVETLLGLACLPCELGQADVPAMDDMFESPLAAAM